ncbi:MAG: EF-hand domain-containing protein [Prosthecobacter sp.]
MKSITSLLAILALAATVNAAEGDKKPEGGKKKAPDMEAVFKKLDKDGNGSISKDEFLASPQGKKDATKAGEVFGKKDKNGDGSLSKEEFTAQGKKKKDA